MYKVMWDDETRGVLFVKETPAAATEISPPRPVFFEELDLLHFNRSWTYPKTEEPLLWAIDRRYYYQGRWVAEARGGNLFETPEIVLTEEGRNLVLTPVQMPLMLAKNQEALRTLECEAIDFVEDTYKRYRKKKHTHFVVSFSGGKDSQVVLDIVSRVIPPDEYIVIFADTTMEIPPTYQAVKEAEKHYTERYPDLKFHTAQSPEHSHNLWRAFGPPSRMQRWCCSVCKTVPVIRLVRNLFSLNTQPRLVVFEGVRSEESQRREDYNRTALSVKHLFQVNSRVIKEWNTTEVFLYLFYRDIRLNDGYRYGLNRVGCSICPFSSDWSEFILNAVFPDLTGEYINILKEYVNMLGIKDEQNVKEYISQRQWKKRGGGKGVDTKNVRIDFIREAPDLEVILSNARENFLEWINVVGNVISKINEDGVTGEIRVNDKVFDFETQEIQDKRKLEIRVKGMGKDVIFLNKMKKILYKTTFCIHCGACEVECPTGALQVIPEVQIKREICSHCGNCLNFSDKGCLMAVSVAVPGGQNMNKKMINFDRYSTFGMRREWVASFFNNLDNWFADNTLGPKQVDAMVAWLRDSELLEIKGKTPTSLCKSVKKLFLKDEMIAWEIIWVNLFYNSSVVKWYISAIKSGVEYSSADLIGLVKGEYSDLSERTIRNGINALINTCSTTPIGEKLKLGIIDKRKNVRYIKKVGTDEIHSTSIAYSLYRFAQDKGRYALTVSEFYQEDQKEGPYRLFGISREKFEHTLRWLQENKGEIVRVDLTADLDNIHLREDLTYEQIATMMD